MVTNTINGKFLFLIIACPVLFLMACSSPAKTAKTVSSKNSPEKQKAAWQASVHNASDNLQRLHRLLQGDFVRYHYRKDSTGKTLLLPWLVNDNKDSVLHHVRPIGDPNKEGYVVLHYLFMSHLPNQPLVMYVEKIEKVSRDTFYTTQYNCSTFPLKDVLTRDLAKDINLKEVISAEKEYSYLYVKESNEKYTLITKKKKYQYSKKNDGKAFYQSLGHVDLDIHKESALFFNEEDVKTSSATNYDIRRYNLDLMSYTKAKE